MSRHRVLFLWLAVVVGFIMWVALQPRDNSGPPQAAPDVPAAPEGGKPSAPEPPRVPVPARPQAGKPRPASQIAMPVTSSHTDGPGQVQGIRPKGKDPLVASTIPAEIVPHGPPPAVETNVAIELDKVRLMLRDYRTLMGENPVGSNAEIMKSLMGDNPRHAVLGPPEGQTVNANGELVDHWGTPYFFHSLAADLMEIHSAGPDRKMWTDDDIVTK